MKVLLIHQVFMSQGEAGGTRHVELSRHLVKQGHSVTVIAASVSYLTGKPAPPCTTSPMRIAECRSRNSAFIIPHSELPNEAIAGIEIVRAWTSAGAQRSFFLRLLSFASFVCSSFIAAMGVRKVDLVWGTSPPIFQAFTAWAVARLKRVPFVFEVRDLWPDFAVQTGVLRSALLIHLSRRLEHFLYRHADQLIVNSPGFIPHLLSCNVPESKIALVPNGVEPGMFRPDDCGARARQELGLEGRFVALYCGAMGLANDLPNLLQAAELLRDRPEIAIVLLGDGKERASLERQAAGMRLANVRFVPAQPKHRMPELLAAADVCVAILKAIPMFDTTYPNKVFDYMAAGRPTVLAIDGVIRRVIETAEGGQFARPGDARSIAECIRRYCDNPALAQRHGQDARKYVEVHFNRRDHALKLEQVLLATLERHESKEPRNQGTKEPRNQGTKATRNQGTKESRNQGTKEPGARRRVPETSYSGVLVKRAMDLCGSIIGLAMCAPLLALVAAAVRIALGRPVLFRQRRTGLGGRVFTLLKFRTMADLRDTGGRLRPDGERLNGFGRFLRRMSLDELPTLVSVLKGEMSLVGPRPLLPEYLLRYSPEQARRHEMKPGITGWAQVNGRNALSWDDKLRLDTWYVDHHSIRLDIEILLKTVLKVLKSEGVSAPGCATAPVFEGGDSRSRGFKESSRSSNPGIIVPVAPCVEPSSPGVLQ
jgi:lipopolysaccharide/colanic/teichoic acid biosynthesis glycosyltransferase/glycosyltransferase involved in cell wall biosynthesis